jgi:hypothetical protein
MAQCESKVFFPEDPRQPPQFNDCPRNAETTRRIRLSVIKLCSTCARVWDEQLGQQWAPTIPVPGPNPRCSDERANSVWECLRTVATGKTGARMNGTASNP